MCSSWMPPKKARYIRAEFGHGLDASKDPAAPYTWLGVDEFTVNGTAPLASGEGIASMGTITLESGNVLNSEKLCKPSECGFCTAEQRRPSNRKLGEPEYAER